MGDGNRDVDGLGLRARWFCAERVRAGCARACVRVEKAHGFGSAGLRGLFALSLFRCLRFVCLRFFCLWVFGAPVSSSLPSLLLRPFADRPGFFFASFAFPSRPSRTGFPEA